MTLDYQHVPLMLEPMKVLAVNSFASAAAMDKGRGGAGSIFAGRSGSIMIKLIKKTGH